MKSFAVTSTSTTQIDLCYMTNAGLVHYYYDTEGNWIGSGQFNSADLLGGVFTTTVAGVSTLATKVSGEAQQPGPASAQTLVGSPVGVSPPIAKYPRLDLFGLGNDYSMLHLTIWSSVPDPNPTWENLGGSFLSTPTAVAWNDRIDVFCLGADRGVCQRVWNGNAWSPGWEKLGGIMSSEVSAVSWGPDRLDIFARGSDYTLRHRTFNGSTWLTDWENFGGSLASQPVAVSWGENRLDIFAVSNDQPNGPLVGQMIHKWWDGSLWNDWEILAVAKPKMTYTGIPAVVTWGPNRIDVFNTGNDGILYHLVFDQGAWANPVALGDSVSGPVSAIALGPNQILLLKFDGSGQVMANFFDQGVWKQWSRLTPFSTAGALLTRYTFTVQSLEAITTRSLNGDTDVVQSTLNAANWPTQSASYTLHNDIGGFQEPPGASIENCSFGPVTVELCESVVFNYQVTNTAQKDAGGVLEAAGKQLANQATNYVSKAIGGGLSAITSVDIGGVSAIPVIGPILSYVANWLLGQIGSLFSSGHCDGLIGVEQVVKVGKDLQSLTAAGPYTATTTHDGIDSPAGCGSNSKYTVTWLITPSSPAIKGLGTPTVTVSASSLSFPEQQIATGSAQQTVTVTATNKLLSVPSIEIVSDSGAAADFTCVPLGSPPPGGSLNIQNDQFTITVWFRPTAAGPRSARLQITNNISSTPLLVELSGTGDPTPLPLLSVSAGSLFFTPKKVTPHMVTLTNSGTAPLTIIGIAIQGGNFSATNTCGVGFDYGTLQPNQQCTINLTCFFEGPGGTSNLVITHNAVGSPTIIELNATSKSGGPTP